MLQPRRNGEKQEDKVRLGPAKPAARTKSRDTLSWEDSSCGLNRQLWKIREERLGMAAAGLLTCIQASDLQPLLQPLLFPGSKRQIVKGRARTRLPHCNVHKKQGGAQCAAPEPSAGPCPQQDECCGAASVCCSLSQMRHTGALDMHPDVTAGISHPPPARDAVMRSALVRDMTDRATEAESMQKPNIDSFSNCTQCTWHEGQWEEGEDQDDTGFSLIAF